MTSAPRMPGFGRSDADPIVHAIGLLTPQATHRIACGNPSGPCNCGLAERLAVALRFCAPGGRMPSDASSHRVTARPRALLLTRPSTPRRVLPSPHGGGVAAEYYPKRAAPRPGKRAVSGFSGL